jgi:hypothetical protein
MVILVPSSVSRPTEWSPLLITGVRRANGAHSIMSISLRAAVIPASEEIFSCKSDAVREYYAACPSLDGIVAILCAQIATGDRTFVAVMAK